MNLASNDKSFRTLISELISKPGGKPSLSPTNRAFLVQSIERIVIDPIEMENYLAWLDTDHGHRGFSAEDLKPIDQLEEFFSRGISCLDDTELIRFALSPFQIRDVCDAFEEKGLSDYWWSLAVGSDTPEGSGTGRQTDAVQVAVAIKFTDSVTAITRHNLVAWYEDSVDDNVEFLNVPVSFGLAGGGPVVGPTGALACATILLEELSRFLGDESVDPDLLKQAVDKKLVEYEVDGMDIEELSGIDGFIRKEVDSCEIAVTDRTSEKVYRVQISRDGDAYAMSLLS